SSPPQLLARPGPVRSRSLRLRQRFEADTLSIHALRSRTADLHRGGIRDDRGDDHARDVRARRSFRGQFRFRPAAVGADVPAPQERHADARHIALEHDPEKWVPVFGKDHAPTIRAPRGLRGYGMRFNPFNSMKAALAVRNLRRSGGRLWVSLFGIAFATLLMAVQGSLLHSFTRAASQIVDAVDADLWIVGKGTPTFDYVSPIPERYAFLALGVDGVRDAGRGIAGW